MVVDLRLEDDNPSPYLFLSENAHDGKLHLRAIDDYMRKHIHKSVLGYSDKQEAKSPHDCRRTYASLEHINGTDLFTLKCQLCHTKITQTEEYIKDIMDSAKRKNQLKGIGIICPT